MSLRILGIYFVVISTTAFLRVKIPHGAAPIATISVLRAKKMCLISTLPEDLRRYKKKKKIPKKGFRTYSGLLTGSGSCSLWR